MLRLKEFVFSTSTTASTHSPTSTRPRDSSSLCGEQLPFVTAYCATQYNVRQACPIMCGASTRATSTTDTTTTAATTKLNSNWDATPFTFLRANVASSITVGGAGSRRVTGSKGSAHNAAVMTPGVTSGVLYWKAKVLALGSDPWAACVGVIGTTSPQREASASYTVATSYGWGGNYMVYIAGVLTKRHGGWGTWSTNDEAAFKLDVVRKTLTMKHKRTQRTYQMTMMNLTDTATWYIHVNLYDAASVEIFPLQAPGYEAF